MQLVIRWLHIRLTTSTLQRSISEQKLRILGYQSILGLRPILTTGTRCLPLTMPTTMDSMFITLSLASNLRRRRLLLLHSTNNINILSIGGVGPEEAMVTLPSR